MTAVELLEKLFSSEVMLIKSSVVLKTLACMLTCVQTVCASVREREQER